MAVIIPSRQHGFVGELNCFQQYRRLLVPNSPLHSVHNSVSRPLLMYVMDSDYVQPTIVQSNYQISLMKIRSHSYTIANSLTRIHSNGTSQLNVNVGESRHISSKTLLNASLSWNYNIDEDQVDSACDYLENFDVEDKEAERRRKIGLANKGKTPWNKGRKHSPETRELIKQRTIEALKDPKVRRKMAEGHYPLSEEIKAKIGLGQRRVWRKRLKLKYQKERPYSLWAESIAEAAKRGCSDQEELEWDSYKKLSAEIALQQLQSVANKKKLKETAKLMEAWEKAERKAKRAIRKKVREEKAKARGQKVKRTAPRKPKEEKEKEKQESPIARGLKLKARITKIRRKKSVDGKVAIPEELKTSEQPAIENLDLAFVEREKLRRELSLADQIQAAKKKKAETATKETLEKGRVEQHGIIQRV